MRSVRPFNPTNPRGYLFLLHLIFCTLYAYHLQSISVTRLEGGSIIGLATLTLLVLTLPKAQLTEPWFTATLTLGDSAALFAKLHAEPNTASWMSFALMLVLAVASYAPSLPQIVVLSSLVVIGHGVSLHYLGLMDTDAFLIFPVLLCLTLVFLNKARIAQTEIQRLTETEEQTRNKSMSDALTGLPNRAQFLEQVTRSIQCGHHNREFHFAVLFIDLDGFKPINDKLGHKAGDAVLRQTAKRLHGCLRKGDLVGRYGGDEFTLLINNVSGPQDAIRVAERVLVKLQEPINVGEPVTVGASIGIALSTNLHERAEDLIRDADGAMYRAKAQGKNRFVVSDQSMDIPAAERKERWRRAVRSAW
jgi:diguanylate cyclase (GGDEF)-like protein